MNLHEDGLVLPRAGVQGLSPARDLARRTFSIRFAGEVVAPLTRSAPLLQCLSKIDDQVFSPGIARSVSGALPPQAER